MNLTVADVNEAGLMGLNPDAASGVPLDLAHIVNALDPDRNIFGQIEASELEGVFKGREHSATTETLRSAADSFGAKPKTDALAGVMVDSAEGAIALAHTKLSDGLTAAAGVASELPGAMAATVMAAGALLSDALSKEGDVDYDAALDINHDGVLEQNEMQRALASASEQGVFDKLIAAFEGHADVMAAEAGLDQNDIVLAGGDPALVLAEAREAMAAKAEHAFGDRSFA